jgi:hypothetical protein
MLKPGPMNNNLNLKIGNNMGTMIKSSIIDERHKRLKVFKNSREMQNIAIQHGG